MGLNRFAAIALTAVCLCAAAQPQPDDIIFSDTFDAAPLGINQANLPGGWIVTGGTIDVIGAPGFDPRPGHGHYIDLQGSSGQPGTLSIEIPVPAFGQYSVEFDWSGNPRGNHGAVSVQVEPHAAGNDGRITIIDVAADTPFFRSGTSPGILNEGSSFVLTFFTPAFVDTPGGRVSPDTGLLLDNVTVRFAPAIPEPATAALLAMGLAAVVVAVRRREKGGESVTSPPSSDMRRPSEE